MTLLDVTPQAISRIDARARGVSTTAADNSSRLLALIAESATTGAELWLPEGTYNAALSLTSAHSGATIRGQGTIRGVGGASPLTLTAQLDGLTVEGITLDGAGVRSGVATTGNGSGEPVTGLTLRACRLQNSALTTTGGTTTYYAIRDTIGLVNTKIEGCTFADDLGGGITVLTPNSLQIVNNRFEGTSVGNFIVINTYEDKSWGGGDGVVIAGNVGRNGGRMGVEIFTNTGGDSPDVAGPVITGNWFDVTGGLYGISMVGSAHGHIVDNTVTGDSTYGLEIGDHPHTVRGNTIYGFSTGIVLNNAWGSVVSGNLICQAGTGIYAITNGTGNSVAYLTIADNKIIDPIDYGIWLSNVAGNDNGYDAVRGNTIIRSQVEADDASRIFRGIVVDVPTLGPRRIERNLIVQAADSPTLTANNFRGIHPGGTNTQPTVIAGNSIVNLSATVVGNGITGSGGAPSLAGMDIHDNTFVNLAIDVSGISKRITQRRSWVSKTANYTAVAADDVISCNAASGVITVTLPTAVGIAGKTFTVKKTDATNNVIVDGDGAQTIDGAATKTITTQYGFLTVISTGSAWQIIAQGGTIT